MTFAAAALVSLAFVASLTLPVLPAETLARTPLPDIYGESAEQIGWPELVAAVEGVVADLPLDERADAIILTGNYGEAGALTLLGKDLPPVYSGHNAFGSWGPPPEDRDITILVGNWNMSRLNGTLGTCRAAGFIDNSVGIENEERGQAISVCRGRKRAVGRRLGGLPLPQLSGVAFSNTRPSSGRSSNSAASTLEPTRSGCVASSTRAVP
jgi:hypothetical protein